MERLIHHTDTLPPTWKWEALFLPPVGFEREWRALLAAAQQAEEQALLRSWAARGSREH